MLDQFRGSFIPSSGTRVAVTSTCSGAVVPAATSEVKTIRANPVGKA